LRTVTALIALAALMLISASFAHAWPGQVAFRIGHAIERVASDQKKSKLPCDGERPPSYCKPTKGSGKPNKGS